MNLYDIIVEADKVEEYRDFLNESWDEDVIEIPYKDSIITLTIVDQYGGEGQGDTYWVVFSAKYNDEKTFYKIDGWYASYSGHEFYDYVPVKVEKVPVQTYEWKKV